MAQDYKKAIKKDGRKTRVYNFTLLEEIIRTHLTDDLMAAYDIKPHKRQLLKSILIDQTREAGREESRIQIEPLYPLVPRFNDSHKILREAVGQCPIVPMDRYLEMEIRNTIGARGLEKVYPKLVNGFILEARDEFKRITHEAGINMKTKPLPDQPGRCVITPFSFLGRTQNYDKYLFNRRIIGGRWLLHNGIFRNMLIESGIYLPGSLVDISCYRDEPIDLNVLAEIFEDMVGKAEKTMFSFLAKMYGLIETDKTKFRNPLSYRHYWSACSWMQAVFIGNAVSMTLEHIVDITGRENMVPLLLLSIKFKEKLTLTPAPADVITTYKTFMQHLVASARSLDTEERLFDGEVFEVPLPCTITDQYLDNCIDRMAANINKLFVTVLAYNKTLDGTFSEIYDDILAMDQAQLDEEMTFEAGVSQIEYYMAFLRKVRNIDCNEFFSAGQLMLTEYLHMMQKSLSAVIEIIFVKLCEMHQSENETICDIFEDIVVTTRHVPKTTTDLIGLGKYMNDVKGRVMKDVSERLEGMLKNLCKMVDFGTLTEEHLKLNAVTVQWLKKIGPIMDAFNTMYEQKRFEAEEMLIATVQEVNQRIANLIPFLKLLDDMDDVDNAWEYIRKLASIMAELRDIKAKMTWINEEESALGFPITGFASYFKITEFVYPFYHLVKICANLKRKINVWNDGQFEFLVHEECENWIEDVNKELIKTQKVYRNKFRAQTGDPTELVFDGVADDAEWLNWPSPLKLVAKALTMIKDFRPALFMMKVMCNPCLMTRHWVEMSAIAGFNLTPHAGTTLNKMMQMGLDKDMETYEIISVGATKERELLNNLQRMQAEWKTIKFKVNKYKDTKFSVLTALDDIQVVLDDHIIRALTMRGSVFVKPYESEVKAFYERILRINKTIDQWGKVQAQWLYLLPIFSSKDIVAQMPEEGVLFKEVNDTFKAYMNIVDKNPSVWEVAGNIGVLEDMVHCLELQEEISEGVASYLEKKRLFFPRFFFLSNDEMLEILSETKDPLRVQPHLKKCFEAINRLNFDEALKVTDIFSLEDEVVKLRSVIDTKAAGGSVEKWLVGVEEQMVLSVRELILHSTAHYLTLRRTQWVQLWQGQIVLAVSQVHWTRNVHKAINKDKDYDLVIFCQDLTVQLQEIVELIRDPTLTALSRITIKALIVIDVHAKDVVEDLRNHNIHNDREFKWLAQLRYYVENDECLVRLINATVKYAYEYLGNTDRLVITPLTDRCYRTLIGAYHLHLNGAPEGPAGTGKTETTKDLAKALAVQCVVFNCSDGLDYKAMGKFFKGLASCGAWVCFDEFNRIDIEVLSVVAQQILTIVMAVRSKAKTFMFEGTELTLNPSCYVCITMNPGYAGRSELPDNLKVLFRTVAMMVPDYALIGEISLYSYGFVDARNLSVKIVTTYRLCSEQLSSQNHYDYGMRAVKSVLSSAGNNKRKFPDENESILLLRAILDVNLPKFLTHDLPLFSGIISDLFPGIVLPKADYSTLIAAVKRSCRKRNLQPKASFITKIIQTYEMMIVRHGFMIVGETFAGKSSTLKVLADSLNYLHNAGEDEQNVVYKILNPKAITMGQLYGQFDPISYEWFDGVVATIFRNYCMDPSPERKWIIFDGPVDAVWIENMNSVLDDNKKLCLMSGEVMSMSNTMSLIFEVMDLEQASPATVSRCGMIFMQAISLGWRPLVDSWLPSLSKEWCGPRRPIVSQLFDWIVPPCLLFLRKKCVQYCNVGEISLVKNTYQLFEMYMKTAWDGSVKKEDDSKHLNLWMKASLLSAIVWGLGGIVDMNSRVKFDAFIRELWLGENEAYPLPEIENFDMTDFSLPFDGLLVDYFYIYRGKGVWKYWPEVVRVSRVDEAPKILQMLVPTIDTGRYMQMMEMFIECRQPFLLVGPTGTGKSFYIQDLLLNKLDKEAYEPAFITFTVQISANQCQELIISKLFKKRRGIYGAPKGKHCVMFIDDINMPEKEIYGAQPPIELLRQFFDHKNWYDTKTTEPLYLESILFTAAMGLVGGSRQEIYPRFLRHFNIISINEFSSDSLAKIFSNMLLVGLKNNAFPTEVILTVTPIIAATLNVYQLAIEHLRPTPSKSHYVFNLRDLTRITQGCALLRRESVEDNNPKRVFVRLWAHEVLRVFYDRLVEREDKAWLFKTLKQMVKDHFKDNFDQVFEHLPKEEDGSVPETSMQFLMFGSYFDQDSALEEKKYEEVLEREIFQNFAVNFLEDYNATKKNKMDIILFDYALEHLSRISRVLTMACGSALLVGISGSGRQSLTRLAAEIYASKLFQPEITSIYGINEWHEDIKKVLKESGGLGKDTVFLIAEDQIKDENFLQDVDCLLNSGEVPNMYQIDEKQEILELVRLAAQGGNRNLDVSPLFVFTFFTKRCKEKLHIVLCFSPVGGTFRTRLRLYPSLINCCTIDWFDDWPETALAEVAENWMGEVNLSDDVKMSCVKACKHFHIAARKASAEFLKLYGRKTYITSASYLELIKSFTSFTNSKQNEIMTNKARYIGGLEKLEHAAVSIGAMQLTLADLQPMLKENNEKAMEMAANIAREAKTVEEASEQVKADEIVAKKQAAAASVLKRECEADLAEVRPIFEEAQDALKTLKPQDITLVKSMKNPPAVVKLVMEAVLILKDIKPIRKTDPATGKIFNEYWAPSVKLLGDINFLPGLQNYDINNIKPELMNRIRKEYLPHPDFKPHIVAKASSAARGLCQWVIALEMYDNVYKIVKPKQEKLDQAQKELDKTMAFLIAKKEQLAKLEKELSIYMEKLDEANKTVAELTANVNLCNDKLVRAQKLIGGLGGEKTRWISITKVLQSQYDGLAGDLLLSCGIIAYLSPFNAQIRQAVVKKCHALVQELKIPCCEDFELAAVLGSDVEIQNWNIYGLPRDTFSTENGIIQDVSRRSSLFIDPQCQASNWIRKMERQNSLEIVKFSYSDCMKKIEMCIQLGRPILIESVEESLEPAIDPILYRKTFKQAGLTVISLGDNVISFHKHFKLYMCTKLRNPHYLPEVYNKVTIINFALTIEGLEDQLLGIVVAVEKPELQQLKEELIIQKAQNRGALLNVEKNILRTLSETEGDILENEKAIQILDESKLLSDEIIEKQKQSAVIEKTIEDFRIKYQGVAKHGAVLYYCISDLANVDPMYQYSLDWFINLYISSIKKAETFKQIEKRCLSLINSFTYDLYSNITRSLFEKDKLLFSLILCCKIMIFHKKLEDKEFIFLLTGGVSVENPSPNPTTWLPNNSWDEICRVGELPAFKTLRSSFEEFTDDFKRVYDSFDPHLEHFPGEWDKVNNFRRLIILRLLRPDKITAAVTNFVKIEMDRRFILPPQFSIEYSYGESYSMCPLIFILSPGTDPMNALVKFAEKSKMADRFTSISLGQGQGPIAQQLIDCGIMEGNWVCLQNCHLAVSWMPTLEKIFDSMDPGKTHEHFRLWLTSYPSNKFPVSVLQKGVKMTNEPPSGLQQNLLKSYITEPVKNPDFYNGCPGREQMFSRLLYGLAFFHAVVQERRSFGPLGWNIPYGFNDSDYDISVQQLQMFINENDDPFEAVSYLIGECNYGGRVTDDWDRRLIVTLLQTYISPEVAFKINYSFSTAGPYYGFPADYAYKDFVDHINKMPQVHRPEVFGLHTNAGITRDLQNSNLLLDSVLKVYASGGAGSAVDTDKYLQQLTSDILSKLPKLFDLEAAGVRYPIIYNESMNTVLVQEMERFNKLLSVIIKSLVNVQRAIQGLVAMSPAIETFCNSLILSRIPASWMSVSYPSLKNLPNYVADFIQRLEFLNQWYVVGKPSNYWLSGFFFTQAFLTGVKQNCARKYKIPIDKLTFDFTVLKVEPDSPPVDGATVYGLFMDGARWNKDYVYIEELRPKILYEAMPSIWLRPILERKLTVRGRYAAPVYKTSSRRGVLSTTGHSTNYVLPILLETIQPPAHWIKRSVALLCQLD